MTEISIANNTYSFDYVLGQNVTKEYLNLLGANIAEISVHNVPHNYSVSYKLYKRGADDYITKNVGDKYTYTNGQWTGDNYTIDTIRIDETDIGKVVVEIVNRGKEIDIKVDVKGSVVFKFEDDEEKGGSFL